MPVNNHDEYAYAIGGSLYLNVTNRCTSACAFCIREKAQGVDGHHLWLSCEPSLQDMVDAVHAAERERGGRRFDEYVFCGYGEPLMRLDIVSGLARELKAGERRVRLNTNGHGNLINRRNVVPELVGLVDTVSISLNAEDAHKYQAICHSSFGPDAFGAMVYFTEQCRLYIPMVLLTVVDVPGVDIDACRGIAQGIGAEFRVRSLIGG